MPAAKHAVHLYGGTTDVRTYITEMCISFRPKRRTALMWSVNSRGRLNGKADSRSLTSARSETEERASLLARYSRLNPRRGRIRLRGSFIMSLREGKGARIRERDGRYYKSSSADNSFALMYKRASQFCGLHCSTSSR